MVQISSIDLNWKVLINKNLQTTFNTKLDNQSFGNHPIVIFYDEYLDTVYYLTMKGYKPHHDLLIKQNLYLKLDVDPNFKYNHKPSVIDTTTIYSMDYNEFINNFKVDPKKLNDPQYFRKLDLNTQHTILEMMIENVDKNRICLKEIENNVSKTLYTNKKWIKKELYNQLINHPTQKQTQTLSQILKDVDDNHLIVSIHKYIDNSITTLQNTNGVRNLVCRSVDRWNKDNNLWDIDPLFINVDQINLKWKTKQKQDLNEED